MVAEITDAQKNTILSTKIQKFDISPYDFAQKLSENLKNNYSKDFTSETIKESQINNYNSITATNIEPLIREKLIQTPREILEFEAKLKMNEQFFAALSLKYPYGAVFTADDNGNMISGKIYKADGSFYMLKSSELPKILGSKDLDSIIALMSDEELKNYCSTDDSQVFLDLLKKYSERSELGEKLQTKIKDFLKEFGSYSEEPQKLEKPKDRNNLN